MRLPLLLANRIQFCLCIRWLYVLIFSAACLAQQHTVRLQPTIIHNGLPNGAVYSLVQDKTGFMWFGTHQGLSRYDGIHFENFHFDPADPTGLSSDNISTMTIGPVGDLWLGTWGGGINRMNLEDGSITHYRHKAGDRETIPEDRILDLLFDRNGMLWIGTASGGLAKMDPATGICRRFLPSKAPNGLPDSSIRAIWEDLEGGLWIATGRGLVQLPADEDSFKLFIDGNTENKLEKHDIRAVIQDREGSFWVGSRYGLARLDPHTGNYEYFQPFQGQAAEMGQNRVNVIYEDRNGRLWLGLESGGLCQFNYQESRFTFVLQVGGQVIDDIRAIGEDQNGNIWVGTRGAGARLFNPRLSYEHYSHNPLDANSLSHNRPRVFTQDGFGHIWIGTEFGLNRFDPEKGHFERFNADPNNPKSLPSHVIRALVEDRDGTLWVGTTHGLAYRNAGKNGFVTLRKSLDNPQSLINNQIQCLFEDLRGVLWVGTQDGLSKLNKNNLGFEHRIFDPERPGSLSHQSVNALAEDLRGDLWIGTIKGLNRLRNGDRFIEHHLHDPKNPNSISNNTIYWIHNSQRIDDDTLWIGTQNGLNAFDPVSGKAQAWYKKDGLPSNQIHGIQSDRNGNLWISTNQGLAIFNLRDNKFSHFTSEHGIQANYFFPGSTFKDTRGRIYFGGINGFNSFNPEFYAKGQQPGNTVLTKIRLDNTQYKRATNLKNVTIEGSIEIQYALLDFSKASLNTYQTRMVGLDKTWQDQGTRSWTRFQNLEPGNYVFEVRGKNSEGLMSDTLAKLSINVAEQTSSFKVTPSRVQLFQWIVIMILLGLVVNYYRALFFLKKVIQTQSSDASPPENDTDATQKSPSRNNNVQGWLLPASRHEYGHATRACKILLIDGQLKNHLSLDSLLGHCGFEVVCIDHGSQAGMAVHRESPDILLLDAVLPDMDGMQLARILRKEHPNLPILVGMNEGEDLRYSEEQRAFCSELLLKPMETQRLLDRIAEHCQISFEKTASS